jgi:hypothetical protein
MPAQAGLDAGTASQLIRGVLRTHGGGMTRYAVIAVGLAAGLAVSLRAAPEPDPRLAGLDSVRLEFRGMPDASNPVGLSDEQLKLVTGLTRSDWVALGRELRSAVLGVLAEHGVPLAPDSTDGCCGCGDSTIPSLVFRVSSSPLAVKPGAVHFSVVAELMEPAELIRRPGVRGRVATWSNTWTGVAEDGSLRFHLQNAVLFWAKAFAESYAAANPKATERGRRTSG